MQYLKLNCMQNIVQKTKCSFPSKIFSYVTPPVLPILLDAKNLSNRSGFGSQTHFLINTVAGVATFTYPRTEHAPEKIGVHMIKETKVKTDQNKTKQNKTMPTLAPFPSFCKYCYGLTIKALVPPCVPVPLNFC